MERGKKYEKYKKYKIVLCDAQQWVAWHSPRHRHRRAGPLARRRARNDGTASAARRSERGHRALDEAVQLLVREFDV
jgi:hypothetical protein